MNARVPKGVSPTTVKRGPCFSTTASKLLAPPGWVAVMVWRRVKSSATLSGATKAPG